MMKAIIRTRLRTGKFWMEHSMLQNEGNYFKQLSMMPVVLAHSVGLLLEIVLKCLMVKLTIHSSY